MAEQRVPFDDRPALEELERLQQSIQEYRRKREQAEGEFEAFVGGFRPQEGQRSNSPARVAAPPAPSIPPVVRTVEGPQVEGIPQFTASETAASTPFPSMGTPPAPVRSQVPESSAPPAVNVPPSFFADAHRTVTFDNGPGLEPAGAGGTRSRLPILIGGGAVLVVAGVLLMRTFSPVATPETPSPAPASAATPTPAAETPPSGAPTAGPSSALAPAEPGAATQPASGASSQGPTGAATSGTGATTPPSSAVTARTPGAGSPAPPAEVRTLRRVWLRVMIDGNRAVEREVEANTNIPLPAGRTFVVRAGDAGAVHFFLNGRDQGALGGEAQVVTRTFTAAGAPPPAR